MATSAPAEASARAVSLPNPPPPPVTTANLPERSRFWRTSNVVDWASKRSFSNVFNDFSSKMVSEQRRLDLPKFCGLLWVGFLAEDPLAQPTDGFDPILWRAEAGRGGAGVTERDDPLDPGDCDPVLNLQH